MLLFEPYTINNKLTIDNRVVMPPVVTRLATNEGQVTPKLIERYLLYAAGRLRSGHHGSRIRQETKKRSAPASEFG